MFIRKYAQRLRDWWLWSVSRVADYFSLIFIGCLGWCGCTRLGLNIWSQSGIQLRVTRPTNLESYFVRIMQVLWYTQYPVILQSYTIQWEKNPWYIVKFRKKKPQSHTAWAGIIHNEKSRTHSIEQNKGNWNQNKKRRHKNIRKLWTSHQSDAKSWRLH